MSQNSELQMTLEQAKEAVKQADTLQRLTENEDFKKIFQEGYFEHNALRLTRLLGDKNVRENPTLYANVQRELEAIGLVQEYMRVTFTFGNFAAEQIKEYNEALASGEITE